LSERNARFKVYQIKVIEERKNGVADSLREPRM